MTPEKKNQIRPIDDSQLEEVVGGATIGSVKGFPHTYTTSEKPLPKKSPEIGVDYLPTIQNQKNTNG